MPRSLSRTLLSALVAWLSLVVAGCGGESGTTAEIEVGGHRLRVEIPSGWERLDHGNQCILRKDFERINIEELGSSRRGGELRGRVDELLRYLGHDARRDIASVETETIRGREVVVVDTWERLSHDYKHRHAFMENEGRVLVVWTSLGRFEDMEKAFGVVLGSIEFVED